MAFFFSFQRNAFQNPNALQSPTFPAPGGFVRSARRLILDPLKTDQPFPSLEE
jgi:hypothetical protein